MRKFAAIEVKIFGDEYLRASNEEDTKRLMAMNKARGDGGACLGVQRWKFFPTAWHNRYTSHRHDATTILEAVPLSSCGFDIIFVGYRALSRYQCLRCHLFDRLASGYASACNFTTWGIIYLTKSKIHTSTVPARWARRHAAVSCSCSLRFRLHSRNGLSWIDSSSAPRSRTAAARMAVCCVFFAHSPSKWKVTVSEVQLVEK